MLDTTMYCCGRSERYERGIAVPRLLRSACRGARSVVFVGDWDYTPIHNRRVKRRACPITIESGALLGCFVDSRVPEK